jgi:hypothetical protein
MKLFTYTAILAAVLPLAACNQSSPPPAAVPPAPPAAPNKPGVDVQAPGVSVQSDKEGTTIRTPGADIDINKK